MFFSSSHTFDVSRTGASWKSLTFSKFTINLLCLVWTSWLDWVTRVRFTELYHVLPQSHILFIETRDIMKRRKTGPLLQRYTILYPTYKKFLRTGISKFLLKSLVCGSLTFRYIIENLLDNNHPLNVVKTSPLIFILCVPLI